VKNSKRYSRQIILPEIGELGQHKLQNSRVLVIGAGGLGCPVLQNLAAAGVGTIGIVDGDVVDETNLHRQLLYTLQDCGKAKAQTAAEAILENNPELKVVVFPEFFNTDNASEIISDYQIIVDCTDTIAVRYLINDVALTKRIPVVYASIHKFEGQLSVFNYKNGPSYRCLFPESEGLNAVPSCEESGVFGVLPNTLGSFQATEVLKIILEIGTVLSGKLLLYDGLHFQTQVIDFVKNPKAIEKGMIKGLQLLNQRKSKSNEAIDQLQFLEKSNDMNVLIIDVREVNEMPEFKGSNVICIPLNTLESQSKQLEKNQEIVLFCQTGQRSQVALNYLKNEGFAIVSHLEKGIQSIEKIIS
jgi:adenylyltransferase/sulfurtransferase